MAHHSFEEIDNDQLYHKLIQVIGFTEESRQFRYHKFNLELRKLISIIMERADYSLDQLLKNVPFQAGLPAVHMLQLVAILGEQL